MTVRTETNRVIWHCTATPEGREVTYDDLWQWHVVQNGWSDIGYHYLIQLDGTVVPCRPENLVGAGVSGHNNDSIHISYAGGLAKDGVTAKDTRTPAQKVAMDDLTRDMARKYGLTAADIHGHNEYAAKACPSFDVATYVQSVIDGETGNPEPGDPDLGNIGELAISLEKRISAIENWIRSGQSIDG